MSEFWDFSDDDNTSDLDALDEYSSSYSSEHDENLDALGDYTPVHGNDDDHDQSLGALDGQIVRDADGSIGPVATDNSDEGMPDMHFSASNPSQTVIVTALLNGMIDYVELSPRAGHETTERELAAEVIAVAEVAATKARSAQYELVYEVMRLQGQDRDSIRGVVEGIMHLPTPEQAIASEAEFTSERTFGHR
ncbi:MULTISPECIES: YbaB/EbfC family DNA-binding protein [unclassified Mycolicibacterium]|uniref:YbaB/EbfC family DNA-binding protein n=1 Tax=unclassified Mycolicibacterium TaxID=2636767 RepID=UPI0012DDB700|nr:MULTISPECIES: YbaB/EbfC family DNA-binding protein [unclassified Mycolicibacterium]MUL82846.1 YbaB/EbfC family DNA-binding protein [Mycolicibacterium sp. CBMA 329]MUL89181.1 YbaB/EbfC family DNA-binding protein [Mycolicibacterium sp. CBMA 331]MUL97748.1 YbaB/EbfC family DNA-binding protein [Mycolicibacterium sp. CBMA 334]MUM25139.1 YbaB/EbfC family DNA-binding protein [Mycolicibacterium sp. CBMA 295]MUM38697.1 YbaB/EbfC family DNA-binding protein [Mycolicibacterium sp. CBMA 247]